MKFSVYKLLSDSAFNKGDFDAVAKYQESRTKSFETFKDQFSDPDAYQNARRMWRQPSAAGQNHDTMVQGVRSRLRML